MKATTFNVSFYCRKSKANAKGFAPIELAIIVNGERSVITLPRKELPQDYKRAVLSKKENDIKKYLEAVRKRVNTITTELMEQGIALTASTLKQYFMYGGARLYTIKDLFDEYLAILHKRVGIDLTPRSYRKYELARDKFYLIIDKSKSVSTITSSVVMDYLTTLRKEFNQPTTNGYGQRLKSVVKYGQSKGLIKTNPFTGIHIRKGDSDIQFLTPEELDRIRDTDCKNIALNRVRDLFIFQSASGMSYCDMAALSKEDIQHNENGQLFVHKRRAKTKVFFTSVILPDGISILEKYDYALPIVSNQRYNAALKFIKDICNIEKPLHTHIARHSYATRCLNQGIRIEVVSKLLGHASTRLTQHYARLIQSNIIKEVEDAFLLE